MEHGRRYAWIHHVEADLHVERAATPGDARFWMSAKPLWLTYRRQLVALYVNDRFVTEWTCADDPAFDSFETGIPADFWRQGKNTLTLRMAYRQRGGDRRELSLGVEKILVRWEEGEDGAAEE
jgi:hypothetical protein